MPLVVGVFRDLPNVVDVVPYFFSRNTRLGKNLVLSVQTSPRLLDEDVGVNLVALFLKHGHRSTQLVLADTNGCLLVPEDGERVFSAQTNVEELLLLDLSLEHVGGGLKNVDLLLPARGQK